MSQIIGIGVDLVEVARIKRSVSRHGERFVRRIFSGSEAAYCEKMARPSEHFAARFAAKEAVLKALGTGWVAQTSFREIEVVRIEGAAPTISLSARMRSLLPAGPIRFWLSISHTSDYAVAQAVITREDETDHALL